MFIYTYLFRLWRVIFFSLVSILHMNQELQHYQLLKTTRTIHGKKYFYLLLQEINCLRNRTTLRFDFSSLVYGLCVNLFFSGTWVDWRLINKNVIFLCLRFIFDLVLHLYAMRIAVQNPEISGFCLWKIRGLRTDHKRAKKNLSGVLRQKEMNELWI